MCTLNTTVYTVIRPEPQCSGSQKAFFKLGIMPLHTNADLDDNVFGTDTAKHASLTSPAEHLHEKESFCPPLAHSGKEKYSNLNVGVECAFCCSF